jgi:hypothetical protein
MAPSRQLSASVRLRRFAARILMWWRKNENSASDNSLGDHVNLPKEFLDSLDRDRLTAKAK